MVKGFVRCGICDKNFNNSVACDKHFKSPEHLKRLARWYELCAENRANGCLEDLRKNAKKVLEEEVKPEVVEFT